MPIEPTEFVWKNGEFIPWEQATVHAMAHALNYGTSVFEGIRAYETPRGPAIFRLADHTKRLLQSAKIYGLNLQFDADQISAGCRETILKNGLSSAYIRPLVYAGVGGLEIVHTSCPIEMVIAAFPWGALHGVHGDDGGLDVCFASWRRISSASNPVISKAGGHYLNSQLIAAEAARNGYDAAIAMAMDGNVSEGAAENLFLVIDGVLLTPPTTSSILQGITRDSFLKLAKVHGIESSIAPVTRELVYIADEVFFTGTATEIAPIKSVDRIQIGDGKPGPITRKLRKAFFGLFDGSTMDSWGWLDYVASEVRQ